MSSPTADPTAPAPDPHGNVADLLRAAAAAHPDRAAVVAPDGTRTWSELDRAADNGVRSLRAMGLQPGERVVVALGTGSDLALALFAAARAGLIAVPSGPSRGDTDVIADRVGAIAAVCPEVDHGLPISIDADRLAQWWADPPGPAEPPAAHGEDLAVLARARGDRAVMLSHRSILSAVRAISRLAAPRLRDADRALQVLPMYHVAGWVVAFLPTSLVGGCSVVPAVGFDALTIEGGAPDGALRGAPDVVAAGRQAAESALAAAREHRVTVVPGAPGFYHHLLSVDGAERALATVRVLTSGVAPLDSDDFAAVRALLGQPVWEGYGLSESASVVTSTLATAAPRHGSVGLPLDGIELRIVGPDGRDVTAEPEPVGTDDGEVADPLDFVADTPDAGEVGRIVIRGDTLFSGYWPDGGGGPDADGWFVTGDVGYLDDEGELRLVDRAAEVITVAGFTVYPREVEDVLTDHPHVAEAAVIGVSGTGDSEQPVAVVVPIPGTRPTPGDLDEFVAGRLPAFKRPVAYHVVPSLPRTEVGRLDRGAVRRGLPHPPVSPLRLVDTGPADSEAGDGGPGPADAPGDAATDVATEVAGPDGPAPDVDVTPELAGALDELGSRLPGTGDRATRGRQDTDEDLF